MDHANKPIREKEQQGISDQCNGYHVKAPSNHLVTRLISSFSAFPSPIIAFDFR
ncbi:uncharacterized protein CYBJADRAFT_167995 [Cyberlindnera jadinii NRRL Y-1542]|uniref:Uncharacterized protein n=1 Tax=Cyberlindnera jadinii (strain ATCC 18201 / CBS 1600 / BCRC 20928 / JCM 3617 / NBRC 0987 / NRRL Y-1542) TaxID=983966 RepID=A0A1E4S077_CYBJN|nr:hypothetical protein CYBJADRAFT_167995 [Cyberlindnera jadinii NRRL Y-1542]ODV72912.1 hypothetical protein CYBJADRAFT_167995 [Cyberlindnera jadinii NRRL Y-1542]